MKGYEDLIAGLLLLVVVLVGGYTYLQSEVFKQKQSLQVPEKHVELKEQPILEFEAAVKHTK